MFENKEGQKVPDVVFKLRKEGKFIERSSKDIFEGKNVVLFALPGAFTPTCSSTHLPRYNDLAKHFLENGVNEIVCLSVNDPFVMEAWEKTQEVENLTLLPDGNGEFSKKLGFLIDKSDIGFGQRSWRYSMYVENGVIKKMFIEPNKPGDPFEVSDADTMLRYLAPNVKPKVGVTIFTKEGCPYCKRAKELLDEHKLNYTEIKGIKTNALQALGGQGTYPLVFLAGQRIGGSDDLEKFLKNQ